MSHPASEAAPLTKTAESLARADALEREITDLCAQINAAGYRLLQLIAELDDQQPWGAWGLASCAHWLNWRCGIGLNAAREKVRVAHALKDLPAISAEFARGRLSFSKVRALTRIADGKNEAELLELALHATAAEVEKLVRGYRRASRSEERDQAMANQAARELKFYYDDDGCLVIRARLPAEQGAVVIKALEAAMDAQAAGEEDETADQDVTAVTCANEDRFAQRRADALAAMAETTLRHGPEALSTAERYQVVVHVTAETLSAGEAGRSELENGQRIAPDTARRIACDGSLIEITEDDDGNPLDIGRKSRAVPPAMQRALHSRDGGCRFPGCTHHRFVDAHHIEHWADGGATSLDNLVLLCRRHHRLAHEGGFGVERSAGGAFRFTRPDGRAIDEHPQLPPRDCDLFRDSISGESKSRIDASKWVIPEGGIDLGLAISGLMQLENTQRLQAK